MRSQKGFTIIELIVVISIIAVLAGVVAVNVMQYVKKAKNAAIIADMNLLPTSAAVYYDSNGKYENFCKLTDPNKNPYMVKVYEAVIAINNSPPYPILCSDKTAHIGSFSYCAGDKWIAIAYLLDNNAYCVDSGGIKKLIFAPTSLSIWSSCSCLDDMTTVGP